VPTGIRPETEVKCTLGTQHVSRKHYTSGTQLCLGHADGQYSPRCSVFVNMPSFRRCCGLICQIQARYDCSTIMVRVSRVWQS